MTLLQRLECRSQSYANRNHIQIKRLFCCGFREITGISLNTSTETLHGICLLLTRGNLFERATLKPLSNVHLRFSQMLFTQAGRHPYGAKLAEFIHEHGLGTVTTAPAHKNPNSGNMVKAFIWAIDAPALITWWNTQVTDVKNHYKGQDL